MTIETSSQECSTNDDFERALLGDGDVLDLLRVPYRELVGREGFEVTTALIVLFVWAIIGTVIAAAFSRTAGRC